MYFIKEGLDETIIEKYGFRKGFEWPENDRFIKVPCKASDYWLIPLCPWDENKPLYANETDGHVLWSIHVGPNKCMNIQCVPCNTFHTDNLNQEHMYYVLFQMIKDGIIEDNYECC